MYKYYNELLDKIKTRTTNFSYGKTFLLQDLFAFKIQPNNSINNKFKLLIQGGIHSREWITAFLCLKLIIYFTKYKEKLNCEVLIVPCSNLDGFQIACEGIKHLKKEYQDRLIQINKSEDFSLWKANFRAVDLNVNFDAGWGTGAKNVQIPSSENYIGPYPNSEIETINLINLTNYFKPNFTISYHSKGEEIYSNFKNIKLINQDLFATIAKESTGYKVIDLQNSAGGYKDYCIEKLKIPSLTIEVGSDDLSHPVSLENLETIFNQNKDIIFNLQKFL